MSALYFHLMSHSEQVAAVRRLRDQKFGAESISAITGLAPAQIERLLDDVDSRPPGVPPTVCIDGCD